MNLIYIVFGQNFNNHLQANFSMLSFLAGDKNVEKIYVMTDDATYYRSIDHEKTKLIMISHEQLQLWQEPHQFFWRIKIKAIQYVVEKYPGNNWLYVDSDTFLYRELGEIKSKLDRGESVMHLNEGKLSELNSKTEKLMWKQSKGKIFLGQLVTEDLCMWNAGVIGLPADKAIPLLSDVLHLCDALCGAGITRRLIEQFAFSVILSKKGDLSACDQSIGHYWANKSEWNYIILELFTKIHLQNISKEDLREAFNDIDLNKLPIYKKESTTRVKLADLVHKLFPDKDIIHIN